jgi:flagellar motor protein MotB
VRSFIDYSLVEGSPIPSPLQIRRNYANAVKSLGGTPQSNKLLSEQRAKAVMAAVVKGGVAATRVSAVGWGQEKPVADNRTEDGRAKNRRVEIVKK